MPLLHAAARGARLWLLCASIVTPATPGVAQSILQQSPADDATFVTRHWHSGNGLPQNTVNSILQTRDGTLWVATLGGVCAFDGERIRVFDPVSAPVLQGSRFTRLCEDRDGTLWIGSDIGGLFSRRDGTFRHHPEVPGRNVVAIAESGDGRLFVATDDGTFVRHSGPFEPVRDPLLGRTTMLERGSSGALYACNGAQLLRLDAAGSRTLATGNTLCLLELDDQLVVGTARGLFRVVEGTLQPWPIAPGLDQAVMALRRANDGALWIGTWMRTHRIAAGQLRPGAATDAQAAFAPLTPARETQATRSLFEDREGGMWVGHTERGMVRYHPADVLAHGLRSGLPQRNLASVSDDGRGGLLVTTMEGLFRKVGARFERDPALDGYRPLRTLLVEPDGTQWFSTEPGLLRRDGNGCTIVAPSSWWPSNHAVAITRGTDGNLWLGGEGLACFDGTKVVVPPIATRFRTRQVRTIEFAPDGAMWLGCTDGLARIDAGTDTIREWRSGRELPFGQVRSVLPEAGERAWIATYGGGVVRVDGGRCAPIDERHGMHDQHLCAMTELDEDFVLSSNRGLCLVMRAEMEAVAYGRAANIDCRMLGTPGGGPAEMHGGYQGSVAKVNGALWFVGIEGLFELDPSRLTPASHDLPTHVQELVVGDRRLDATTDLSPAPGIRSLTIRLGTCAFDSGERVRFRWRVVGVHDEWSPPTYERDVRLVDLPPGDHVFEASTLEPDGTPAESTYRMHIHLPRLWWEAAWLRPMALLVVAGLAVLLVRFGAHRAAARAAHLQTLVDARTHELVESQQQLEQRVADRTTELRLALARQEAAQEEQRNLERQLQRMQRMESIGQLAGGIAHDFNNLLTVVNGASEMLVDEESATERAALCDAIEQASQRGRNLTQHLLAVASRQHVATEPLDLVRVVTDLQPVLKTLLGDSITLRVETSGTAPVRAAVTQIEQILLNLCGNARDAMPRGGAVTVSITTTPTSVRFAVHDNGTGMTADVVERAFEPFFSTKGPGGTRGLGLATVYGIAKQLSGQAHIASTPGSGTTVTIELPRDTTPRIPAPVLVPSPAPARLQARVLLIEDEDCVRTTMQRLLAKLGCPVRAAANGTAALDMLRAMPDSYDIVLSDVVMPGLHGRRLVDELRSVRPGLPIVFLTGYLDGRLTHRDLMDAGLEILAKPIVLAQLTAAMARALARATNTPTAHGTT